jgi:O-antigen ligase
MPLAYAQVNEIDPSHKKIIIYTFILGIILSAIQALAFYYFHQSEINQAYLESRVMPTAVSQHPTFSLMCTLAIYLLYNETQAVKNKTAKILLAICTIFLITFLHIFSVRAGILAFYLLVLISIYQVLIPQKKYLTAAIIILTSVSIAVTTYLFSPTIKNKIANTQADLSNYKNGGNQNNQSLGSRLISYQNAIEINKTSSWLLGCGLGDIEDLNNAIFQKKYPLITKKIIPHSQFLYYFAAIGALGVLIFSISFYFPIYKQLSNFNLLALYAIITIAFLIEPFLTRQLGVAFCILFILLFIHRKPSNKTMI